MKCEDITDVAHSLYEARTSTQKRDQITNDFKGLTLEDAYTIQEAGFQMRLDDGESYAGMKMGLTSEAKRTQMGLDSPCYGRLTDEMEIPGGSEFSLKNSIHPKIEPEIAFQIGSNLKWPVTIDDVKKAITGACASLEILDTRYQAFKYFSLEDVVADNSSSFKFAVGEFSADWENLKIDDLKMQLYVNDKLIEEGNSKAISGNPLQSVVDLCKLLNEREQHLKGPCIVLTGAATPAVTLEPNMKVELKVEGLAPVSVSVTE